jgi:hypothetical protein
MLHTIAARETGHMDEIEGAEEPQVEVIKVRMTPTGEMDSCNAGRYINRSPQTLAHWRVEGKQKGPEYEIRNGRVIYTKRGLDKWRAKERRKDAERRKNAQKRHRKQQHKSTSIAAE